MSTTHTITWSPSHAELDKPRVSNRVADLGTVFVNVGTAGQYMVADAAAARAMAAAFTQAADLLDQAAAEGEGK